MKKLLFIIVLVSISLQSFSQKLEKYEDVLPSILALPQSGALSQLRLYLYEDPENGSIYLQMAVIYQERFENSDPIKDYAYKLGNAKKALEGLNLAEKFIDERDVRKNEEHYFNFGTKDDKGRLEVEFDTISSFIASSKVMLNDYIEHMPLIYEKFTQSFSHYDRAHKLFMEVLGTYPTYKDLYLLYDNAVDQKFTEIDKEYQLCLQYWDEYLSAKDSLDIGYSQKIVVQPVKVYRLDGMESKINFLQNEITLWDYTSWVTETRSTINAEIDKLRRDLAAENIRLNKRIEQAIPDFIREDFEPLKVSKEILFNLRKYDLNSVIEPIFLYKEKKHDLIYQGQLSQTLDTATVVDVDRKLYLYGEMINHIKDADSVLADVSRRNQQDSMDKYAEFINTHYGGLSGITQMVNKERQNNSEDAVTYVDNIQSILLNKLLPDSLTETFTYNKMEFPMMANPGAMSDSLVSPVSLFQIENFDGSQFIGGVYPNEEKGLLQAYVAGITNEKNVGWFNEYLLQPDSSVESFIKTQVGAIQAISGGLAVILNGTDSMDVHINHLLLLDEKGQITHSRRLMLNQYPRSMTYNERTNTLLVTYKGDDFVNDFTASTELIMANYSVYGDLLWQKRVPYKGDLTGVVKIESGYIIMGNYNEIKGMDGRINRAGLSNSDSKLFAMKIDHAGNITDFKTFDFGSSYYSSIAYRVSDDCINIFGSTIPGLQTLDENEESRVHFIVNKDMEVLSNSMN